MDLINPSPQVFERKDTDRRVVSGRLDALGETTGSALCRRKDLVPYAHFTY